MYNPLTFEIKVEQYCGLCSFASNLTEGVSCSDSLVYENIFQYLLDMSDINC